MRRLLLLLPRTRGPDRVPAGSSAQGGGVPLQRKKGGGPCGNSVKETSRSSRPRCWQAAEPIYGYPITPASEIAEYAALLIPEVGGTFLQAESEVAAINMVYGASSAGMRVMSASSGPGLSLMQEGMSYIAGAELPCVIVDVVRGGPGLGNIAPEQSDYFCVVKGGGHGCYRNIVLAPASVQEMFDLTVLAFELADRYRNPVVIMTDGYVGQMQEPLEIKLRDVECPRKTGR